MAEGATSPSPLGECRQKNPGQLEVLAGLMGHPDPRQVAKYAAAEAEGARAGVGRP